MSEVTGQKPTNKKCRMCEVPLVVGDNITPKRWEQCVYYCQPCERIEMKNRRMFVNGKYISNSHPLYKPGRYGGFTDAAFSSLKNYKDVKEGFIYIIYNKSFPGWVKIGMAVDVEDRLKQFQTSSPHRDYTVVKSYKVSDRREAELKAHKALDIKGRGRKGEWFYMPRNVAVNELDNLFFTGEQLELF